MYYYLVFLPFRFSFFLFSHLLVCCSFAYDRVNVFLFRRKMLLNDIGLLSFPSYAHLLFCSFFVRKIVFHCVFPHPLVVTAAVNMCLLCVLFDTGFTLL